uniref:Uncharacterized protein n=1 Tax=Picea glauca TaxID=3330 RepID=A0A117NFU7_PICGL|nr:hypothetical protein ABT39_MTgene2319 [Picea glauca]
MNEQSITPLAHERPYALDQPTRLISVRPRRAQFSCNLDNNEYREVGVIGDAR